MGRWNQCLSHKHRLFCKLKLNLKGRLKKKKSTNNSEVYEAIERSFTLLAGVIEKASERLSRAIGEDMMEKHNRIRDELQRTTTINAMEQHKRYKELWLMLAWDFLPVREVVNRQMDVADTTCPLCGMILESATHLFLYCQSVRPLWFMSRWCLHTNSLTCDSMSSFLEMVLFGDPNSNMRFDGEFLLYASILVDAIWLARNKLIREAKGFNIADIHSSVQAKFNHVIQLNHHGSCNSVSRAIVKDSYMIEPYPKRAKLSDSL